MAQQTFTTFDAMLKDDYAPYAYEQLNQGTWMLGPDGLIRKAPGDIGAQPFQNGGRDWIFPVHSSRNRGRGSIGTGGPVLPNAGKQGYSKGIVTMRYHAAAIEIDHMATLHATGNNSGAFANVLTTEIDGCVQDEKKDVCRQLYGTGDGLLATITANATSATQAVDSGQYIAVGDTVDVLTKATGAVKGAGLTVLSVTYTGIASSSTQTAANIVLSASVVATTADGIYIAGNRNMESDGLRNIAATTNRVLHTIDSTTNKFWDPVVFTPATPFSNVSEDILVQMAQTVMAGGNGMIDVIATTLGIFRRLANTYTSQRRYNDAAGLKLPGGWSAINISAGGEATPVVADVDAPKGFAFGVNRSSLMLCELTQPQWMKAPDGTGSTMHLKDGTTAGTKVAAWQSWYLWPMAAICIAPNRNGAVTQLADDLPVQRV